ncbi:hypothetical protein [Thioalkalivibrio thiocyanodenitrificans]|uniref:hypothetical protein n=1 Tax=Thioalkalivibrio thiocyanodenitrificans TaxID=243063 RepID=UPI000362E8E0|nr:hypothetical protein [Thioalkalivibrio thiocyanodenitrificans]
MTNRFAPPETLAAPEADIYRRLQADYDVQDAPGLVLLHQLCRSLQLAREAREQIDRDGLLMDGKAHPLCGVLRDAEKQAAATMRQLNFDTEPLKAVGRPPMAA